MVRLRQNLIMKTNSCSTRLWPGRSVFRVGSSEVASKYSRQHSEAPRNRKELFKGSVNYHWRSDEHKIKGRYSLSVSTVR